MPESLRKQAKESLKSLFHHKKQDASMPEAANANDILHPTSLPKISNLGAVPKELKPGMDAATAQSVSGAPNRLSEAAHNQAPSAAAHIAGGPGNVPAVSQHMPAFTQNLGPQTPEGAGYARLTEEGPLAPTSTPVGSIAASGLSSHPPSSDIAAASVNRAGLGDTPAMGAGLAQAGVSEKAALAAQAHALHHVTETHDTSAPYLGPSVGAGAVGAAKPAVMDVGALPPALEEQKEPLLPSGKRSSPVTGHVPPSVMGKAGEARGDDIEQDAKVPTGYLGSKEGKVSGLGTGELLKEHASASKEQDAQATGERISKQEGAAKGEGGAACAPEAGLPSPAGDDLTSSKGARSGAPQAPTTLLGRAQEALVHAAAATSAAGTVVVNKVSEATGMASSKAKATGDAAQQQAGDDGTGLVQQVQGSVQGTAEKVQQGAKGAYEQVASAAPLQRVVEYGQAAAAKASEQAQAAYEAATAKLHEMGVPQKVAEHRDAASAKASDLSAQAQQTAAQAKETAAAKAAQLQDAARAKAAELYTQAADTTVAAKEQATRAAALAADQAAQALGEGIEKVRNATPEDINRSRLARGLAMATLLWVLCSVLGIPFKLAVTAIALMVGGMLVKELLADRRTARVGGRGPHGGVRTTEFSSHAPTGRVHPPAPSAGPIAPPSGLQGIDVTAPAPVPPMLGQEGVTTVGAPPPAPAPQRAPEPQHTVHTDFGPIKVVKPVMDDAHRAAKAVEE